MTGIRLTSAIGAETLISDSRLSGLVSYWRSRSSEGSLPLTDDIDPLDFHYLWGYVCLVDVIHNGLRPRFQFWLDGSKLSAATGDWTGRFIDEIDLPDYVGMTLDGYHRNVFEREPLHHLGDLVCDQMPVFYEAVALPLQISNGAVGRLLVGVIPDSRRDLAVELKATNSIDLLLRH